MTSTHRHGSRDDADHVLRWSLGNTASPSNPRDHGLVSFVERRERAFLPAPYTKPHLDLPAQVRLLASRGLVIPDPQTRPESLASRRVLPAQRLLVSPPLAPVRSAWDGLTTSSREPASTRSSACTTSTGA